MSNEACKTPVEDLLRAIPRDHVIQFEIDDNGWKAWHNCPIGLHAHEAADLIAQLKQQLEVAHIALKRTVSDINELEDEIEALSPLPASSGPEQPKCRTCDNSGKVTLDNMHWNDCPDCAIGTSAD